MQYYEKPQNSDLEILFKSLDRMMECVDQIYEFRVLGGDPFMNKELHKTIEKLKSYKNAQNIVVYTNATIIPKNENFECLKNDKITIEITNYGKGLSRKHSELVELLSSNNINYRWETIEYNDLDPQSLKSKDSKKYKYQNIISPKISLNKTISNQNLFFTISHGYSPPNIDETLDDKGLVNQNIKRESGWNYELGIRGNLVN